MIIDCFHLTKSRKVRIIKVFRGVVCIMALREEKECKRSVKVPP